MRYQFWYVPYRFTVINDCYILSYICIMYYWTNRTWPVGSKVAGRKGTYHTISEFSMLDSHTETSITTICISENLYTPYFPSRVNNEYSLVRKHRHRSNSVYKKYGIKCLWCCNLKFTVFGFYYLKMR